MMAVLFLGPFMLKPPKESNVFMSDTKQIFKFFSFGATMVNFYAEQKRYFVDKYGKLLNSKDRIVGRDIEIFNSTST
ncbi:hypothetical protein HDE_08668 [Halotydeus destructor]|nr:hypothetical protein HDE_08668 [Halotydeus destructor]